MSDIGNDTRPQGSGQVPFWRGTTAVAATNTPMTPLAKPDLFDDPRTGAVVHVGHQHFPRLGWDPTLKAMAIAAEFAATGNEWKQHDPGVLLNENQPHEMVHITPNHRGFTQQCIADDVRTLLAYRNKTRDGRADRQGEILAQADGFQDYFAHLLAASAHSRPATYVLMQTGYYVGGLVAAFWKLHYMRARPVQVCPNLYPVIITPPHPSFPSGHALQSFTASKCAKLVAPAALHGAIDILATRIAENREYAGVHYPSDTEASRRVSERIFPVLNSPQVPSFLALLAEAKQEWV